MFYPKNEVKTAGRRESSHISSQEGYKRQPHKYLKKKISKLKQSTLNIQLRNNTWISIRQIKTIVHMDLQIPTLPLQVVKLHL